MRERTAIHGLSLDRWHSLDLMEQLGNIGSEVGRAMRAKEAGNEDRMWRALERMLELFDMTIADPLLAGRRKEICRAREVVLDFIVGANDYASTAQSLDLYFTQYGVAARRGLAPTSSSGPQTSD